MMIRTLEHELLPENHRPQLGLIVLQSDVTIEDEFRHYFNGSEVSLLCNRIPFENEVTADTLKQMEGHLQTTMSLFPLHTHFDALGYACTSGALHIGSDRIAALVREERTCTAVTDPMQAAKAALAYLGATRIAYLAPYSVEVSASMVKRFNASGIQVESAATFDESQDRHVGNITPECIRDAAIELCADEHGLKARDELDAVFIACTNLKAAGVIPAIEERLGIPALSSNQVLAWHLAQLAGAPLTDKRLGRLFA